VNKLSRTTEKSCLNGSMVALITPMDNEGQINFKDFERLIHYHLENKTDGLVILGTTGEAATISAKEREKVIKTAVSLVTGKIPVIIGTGHNCTQKAIELTKEAAHLGADAGLIVTPYYNKPSQKGLIAHYKAIASNTDLPIILYNVPGRTACDMLPETVAILANDPDVPNIIGLKEAVGSTDRINQLINLCPKNFSILSGDDETFLNLLKAGGHGIISVTCNIVPEQLSNICRHARNKNWQECEELNSRLINLHQALFVSANPMPIKWAMYKSGLISTPNCRLPLLPLESRFYDILIAALSKAGIMSEQI